MTSSKPQGLAPWPPSSTSNREASSASARQETPGFGGLVQWLDAPQGSVKGAGSLLGQTEHVCGAGSAGGACSAPDRPRRAGLQRRWLSRIPEPQARACLPDSRLALTAWKKQKEPLASSGHVPVTAPPPTHTHTQLHVMFQSNSAGWGGPRFQARQPGFKPQCCRLPPERPRREGGILCAPRSSPVKRGHT